MNPRYGTKAQLLNTIRDLQRALTDAHRRRREAEEETRKILEQRPELQAFREFAEAVEMDPSGDIQEILERAAEHFNGMQEKYDDACKCENCGEKTEHHFCAGCYTDPEAALIEVFEIIEEPADDPIARRFQREALERISEETLGRTLRRAS